MRKHAGKQSRTNAYLKESTVRTVLRNLKEKGYIKHTSVRRAYLYRPVETKLHTAVHATRQIIERFCEGSAEELLIGLVDNGVLSASKLKQLAAEIDAVKEERMPDSS